MAVSGCINVVFVKFCICVLKCYFSVLNDFYEHYWNQFNADDFSLKYSNVVLCCVHLKVTIELIRD